MIDLHCHMCFGVDDGPRSAADTIELARALLDAGVTEIACTSHIRPNKGWMNDVVEQDKLHAQLDDVFAEADIELPHHRAAEHYFDVEVLAEDFDDRLVPYGDSKWLLVEMPYEGEPPDALGPLYRLRRRGWKILLAHVERYPWLADDDDKLERLTSAGYLIQVNLGSLGGFYTRAHRKAAERLLKKGVVSVAAGDCHRAKDVKGCIQKGLRALEKHVGADGVRRMTVDVPRAILDDAAPEALWP